VAVARLQLVLFKEAYDVRQLKGDLR